MSNVIRLSTINPVIISTEEYENLKQVIIARFIVGDIGLAERIIAKLLLEHAPRYYEAKRINEKISNV